MPILFSSATGYALRVLSVLPASKGFVRASDLAERLGIPGFYLSKILQTLTRAGILESFKGPTGGFRLARPAAEVRVRDVMQALEGANPLDTCILGVVGCRAETPCPMHVAWHRVRPHIDRQMLHMTIAELQRQRRRGRRTLAPGGQPA